MAFKGGAFRLEQCLDALIDYRGRTPPKVDSGVPLITAKVVKNGRIRPSEEFIAESQYLDWMTRGLPAIGDVVLTTEAPLGEVGQIQFLPVALAQRIVTLRGKAGMLDNNYLLYLLQSDVMQSKLHDRSTGTTVVGIKQSELRRVEVELPPLSEQCAVGNVLKVLDDRIENLRQANITLETIAQSLFKSWFVDFDPVRAKAEGRELEGMDAATSALFPDTFKASGLGLIPEGWEVSNLGDQLEILSGGTPKTKIPEYWDGDIPWFSVVDAPKEGQVFVFDTERRISQSGLENSPARLLPANTTIISARGTVGKLAVTGQPMAMNQSCYGLRPADGVGEFLTYLSVQRFVDHLQRIAHGAVFDTITRSSFSQAQTVNAPKQVVSAFEALVTPLMERLHANGRQAITLAKLRDTLLPRLISGKLRLPEVEREIEAATV